MVKVLNYISDSFEELRTNVSWTPWAELQRLTIIVALFSIIFALATWGVDESCAKIIAMLFKLINS